MGFNLYFAGSQAKEVDQHIIDKKCNRLFSQLNEHKGIMEYANLEDSKRPKLLIDSGAFSVAHSNKTVNLDDYISFINELDDKVTAWVQLDSIPFPVLNADTAKVSANKSWENYLHMLTLVKSPEKLLPIYHFGEPKEHLERILNTPVVDGMPAPYIGIGGRHGVSVSRHLSYFQDIFTMVKKSKNPNVKIHAFGMTVLSLLEKFPFYSADSTTWLQLGVNGNIVTKHGIFSVSDRTVDKKDNLINMHSDVKDLVIKEIESFGYTLEQVSTDYKLRLMYNIDYFKNWADNYEFKGYKLHQNKLF